MIARIGALAAFAAGIGLAAPPAVSFADDVAPLFAQHCAICHGPNLQQSGFRLDRRDDAMRGGHSGRAIVAGSAESSPLIQRLLGHGDLQSMPPGAPLAPEEIEVLRAWIDLGAPWDAEETAGSVDDPSGHWAFRPNRRPEVPAVSGASWIRNPIDAFVLSGLEREDLGPSPEASPETLARRAHLDITGLPPTPEDLANAGTYESLVEGLLDSEHYGERWASQWLDLVRYADSDGYEKDSPRPHAWRYRHWVIDALNRDMPFDEFTVAQIAGDLLPDPTTDQRVATGFYRNTLKNREGGVNVEEFRFEEVVDRTNTVATVWLGLSMECARCHDHKYDPITQADYYRMFAFFNSLDEVDIDAPLAGEVGPYLRRKPAFHRSLDAVYREYKVRESQRPWEAKMLWAADNPGVEHEWDTSWDILALYLDDGQRILRTPPEERDWREDYVLTEWFLRNYSRVVSKEDYQQTGFSRAAAEVRELAAEFPDVSRARAVQIAESPPESHLHPSGEWDDLGSHVTPGVPVALPPLEAEGNVPSRLDLARWLASGDNPLTARVAVNRIWQRYFGTGLVTTPENFGLRGEAPSHPDLLDWLAAEFVDSGWSLKHIHRLIATSATYRQSSRLAPELVSADPGNRALARQARLRLDAESLRDASLAVSGLLDPRVGGRSVRPQQPAGVTDLGYAGSVKWVESEGSDRYRRAVYIHFQRTTPYPLMANFDLQERNVTQCARNRSNTPLQALNLLNDPAFFEMAQGLAYRVVAETQGSSFDDRLDRAFQLCLLRKPRASERETLLGYFVRQRALLERDESAASQWFPIDTAGEDQSSDPLSMAAWVGVSRVLLNMDEFITRE